MKRILKKNRKLLTPLCVGAVCLLVITALVWAGSVYAAEDVTVKNVTVTYTAGTAAGTALGQNSLFADVSETISADISGCVTLTGSEFDDVITTLNLSGNQIVDPETFYFDTYSQSALDSGSLWAYTFTGWKIAYGNDGTTPVTLKMPSKTVFQPGDVITPEVLAEYAKVTDSETGAATLTLEALWAKCYFIQNPYKNMVYQNYTRYIPNITVSGNNITACTWQSRKVIGMDGKKSKEIEGNATGAWDARETSEGSGVYTYNRGNDPENPLASIDFLYQAVFTGKVAKELGDATSVVAAGDPYDAYATAIVLTGDLDYVLDENSNLTNNGFIHFNKNDPNNILRTTFAAAYPNVDFSAVVPYANLESGGEEAYSGWRTGFIVSDGSFYRDQNEISKNHTASRAFGNRMDAPAVTFKSLRGSDDAVHTLFVKPYNDQLDFYASLRMDNIYFTAKLDDGKKTYFDENVGTITALQQNTRSSVDDHTPYFMETTARLKMNTDTGKSAYSNLRTYKCFHVDLKGGEFATVCVTWAEDSSADKVDPIDTDGARHWYFGRNVRVGTVDPGSTYNLDEGALDGDVYITVTGTSAKPNSKGISLLSGGSYSADFTHTGNRFIRVYGDGKTPAEGGRTIHILELLGGTVSSPLYGDVDILISGVRSGAVNPEAASESQVWTGVGDVYGGGQNYTANVYGNISVRIVDSDIRGSIGETTSGNVFGGGKFGSCLDAPNTDAKEGQVSVSISGGSKLSGSVFGAGMGNFNSVTTSTTDRIGMDNRPADWQTPPTGFPAVAADGSEVLWHIEKRVTWKTGSTGKRGGMIWAVDTTRAAVSVASAENTEIVIDGSSVEGNIYGGGNMGLVRGNTSVTIRNGTTVGLNVYGGSDGKGPIANIQLYEPVPEDEYDENGTLVKNNYDAPEAYEKDNGDWALPSNTRQSPRYGISLGNYTWVYAPEMLTQEWVDADPENRQIGIDHKNNKIYANARDAGQVFGSTNVSVEDSTVGGVVYGGGNAGSVKKTATVNISDCTLKGVYGGGNSGDIEGTGVSQGDPTTTVVVHDSQINGDNGAGKATFGGCQAGKVTGNTSVTLVNTKHNGGHIVGGGYQGVVTGNTNVSMTGCESMKGSSFVIGGGYQAGSTVQGDVYLTITDCDLKPDNGDDCYVFGGGSASVVKGSTYVTMTNTQVSKSVFGGGHAAVVEKNSTLKATNSEAENFFGGGNGAAAHIYGDATLEVQDCKTTISAYGGGSSGRVDGNTSVKVTGTEAGGTNIAYGIYGGGNGTAAKVAKNTSAEISGNVTTQFVYGGGNAGAVTGNTELYLHDLEEFEGQVFGGGNKGAVGGKATTRIEDTSFVTIKEITQDADGNSDDVYIFGGGNAASVGSVSLTLTDVIIDRINLWETEQQAIDGAVFGGGNAGKVTGDVDISFTDCKILSFVFGGGNQAAAAVEGKTTVKATRLYMSTGYDLGTKKNSAGKDINKPELTFYGGGRLANCQDIDITIEDGIYDWFYGAGYKGDAGNVTLTMQHSDKNLVGHKDGGNSYTLDDYLSDTENSVSVNKPQPIIHACFRAGGDAGDAGDISLTFKHGYVCRNAHLAGYDGTTRSVTAVIGDGEGDSECEFSSALIVGSDRGFVTGIAKMTIKNGKFSSSGVYGGGDRPESQTGQTELIIEGGTFSGNVYGGSRRGWLVSGTSATRLQGVTYPVLDADGNQVYENGKPKTVVLHEPLAMAAKTFTGNGSTNVTITGGTFNLAVYAGSNGEDGGTEQNEGSDKNRFGEIYGSTKLTITGGTFTSVYGGNNAAGTINLSGAENGGTFVTVGGNASVKDIVFGAGNGGAKPGCVVNGDTHVTMTGGKTDYIFGGSNAKGTVTGNTNIALSGGTITYDVYGGNNSGGTVEKDANITVTGGTVRDVFGGNNKQGAVEGSANIRYSGGTIRNIIGGNNAGGTVGKDSNIFVTGGSVNYVFCGNNEGGTLGGTGKVTISDGVAQELYGGNNLKGTVGTKTGTAVSGGTEVNIQGGTVKYVFGGGNSGGTIYGTVNVNMTGGEVTGYLAGGGYKAAMLEGTVSQLNVNISGGKVYDTANAGGGRWVYGGGYQADVAVVPHVRVSGTARLCYLAGGGYGASCPGTDIHISGDCQLDGVFGGGDHSTSVITGDTKIVMEDGITGMLRGGGNLGLVEGNAYVEMTGGYVVFHINGGGNKKHVNGNTTVKVTGGIVGQGKANENHGVFGGGDSTADATGKNIAADVLGNATVEIGGTAQIRGMVCGGGNQAPGRVHKNTYVTIKDSAQVTDRVFGGGNQGVVLGDATVNMTGGTVGRDLFGGGNEAAVANTIVNISGGSVTSSSYGGGNRGTVLGNTTVNMTGGTIGHDFFGGGNQAEVTDAFVTVSGGRVTNAIYGGGLAAATRNVQMVVTGEGQRTNHLYGGGYQGEVSGDISLTIDGTTVTGEICGGGYGAAVKGDISVTVTGDAVLNSDIDTRRFYGGGKSGEVLGDVTVLIESGEFRNHVYGGGSEGKVHGAVKMTVLSGSFAKDITAGGRSAPVYSTDLRVGNGSGTAVFAADPGIITVEGSVFGGGEGANADVQTTANVVIDMPYDFTAKETVITTTNITPSGQINTVITDAAGTWGVIKGSVYGGGDLGRVGNGTITVGGESATITVPGTTKVTVENGKILGSVFGGGNGVTSNYTYYMGVVFGSTDVDINGGRVLGNVYGGGRQSRVYANATQASHVEITEIPGKKIAIGGSVFGGGDRGEGTSTNASIPTTIGDVYVLISGIKDEKPSHIYFEGIDGKGGIYGDGNLCLVDGKREIKLLNFEPAEDTDGRVKTFYSLQRADKVIMDNSAVVLLGAPDLVDENDTGTYSINRVDEFIMENGSAVKLDQVVKYMGTLYSDVETDRKFIHDGVNGFTGSYPAEGSQQETTCKCKELNLDVHQCGCLNPLTDAEINNYRTNVSKDTKNVVCVANGLYLEVKGQDNEYGPVTGLFTLQLLYANPGEGGGFVYGSIPESTGDFICETQRWSFQVVSVTAETFDSMKDEIYIRVAGKAFQRPSSYSATQTYYKRSVSDSEEYMEVIDDVGGLEGVDYAYYYWFIGGPSITYNVDVTGYIGTTKTAFPGESTIPQHKDEAYSYVLYGVSASDKFLEAVLGDEAMYQLVQTADGLTGEQIAIELKLGDQSLGFLKWDEDKHACVIQTASGDMIGYTGDTTQAYKNNLITTKVNASNDTFSFVLHKSSTVSTTVNDLEVYLDLDLHSGTGENLTLVKEGTSMLSYTADINIVRLVPIQSVYYDNLRSYTGVAMTNNIHITGNSSFTAEYQTTYVPAAFPKTDTKSMYWALTAVARRYYMTESGINLTVDPDTGEVLAWSETIAKTQIVNSGEGVYYYDPTPEGSAEDKTDWEEFVLQGSFVGKDLPKNTKITMVDLTGGTPEYYYYICATNLDGVRLDNFCQMGTNTKISTLVSSGKAPSFMKAYEDQEMDQIKERLLFILNFEQADQTAAAGFNATSGTLESGFLLQHFYSDTDIMNYSRKGADGSYTRAFPKETMYLVNNAATGVNSETYTAAFHEASYDDLGNAELTVNAEEDPNWINTLFRENGFALKIQLMESGEADAQPIPMPAGMFFEYKGQNFSPGPDSTYVSVPVHEFGTHQIVIHNPSFSLADAAGGSTAYYKVSYYSAPDATYYNSFDTGVAKTASHTIKVNPVYALSVAVDEQHRIVKAGETVKFTLSSRKDGAATSEKVSVALYRKGETGYESVALSDVLNYSDNTVTPGSYTWKVTGTQSGTYRIVFRYGDHTEYFNFIIP